MKYFLLIIMFISYPTLAKDFKLVNQSADRLPITQSTSDTVKLKSILFKSIKKTFKVECDSTDFVLKGIEYVYDYSKLENYSNEIIFQVKLEYLSNNGKLKTESVTIFKEDELRNPRGETMQCIGITKKGTQCKRTTNDPSGYCWQHK